MIVLFGSVIDDGLEAFPKAASAALRSYYGGVMAECADIYRGEPPWSYVKRSGLYGKGERRLSMLGCAKVLCDSLAALTFSSQADIICGDRAQQEYAMRVLQENGFWEQMPAFLSRAYALGGGVIKVAVGGGKVFLDFISADSFIPTGYGHGGINEGIFRSRFSRGGTYFTLMEKHGFNRNVTIDRVLFASADGSRGKIADIRELDCGLEEHSDYPMLTSPVFAYFRPAAANNLTDEQLMGISCFANCIDTLKALDIAFDSFSREFVLGRKRIIVPSSCIRTVVDPDTGKVSRYFDTDDEVYQALKCDEEKDLKITDNTAELRVQEHTDAINALLDILCFQVGLSSGTLSFTGGSVKTAAEVKSMETRTEITMQQNRCMAAEFIEKVVRAVIMCGMMAGELPYGGADVRICFSDRQTVDRSEIIDRNVKLVGAGLRSRLSAVMEVLDCSEEEARRELERIKNEEEG